MLDSSIQIIRDAALEVAWAQWAVINAAAASRKRASATIDPEALVLLSLSLRGSEKRLWDLMAGWAVDCSRLLSVRRTKNLLGAFPDSSSHQIRQFARLAIDEGKDWRWQNLADIALKHAPRAGKSGRVIDELIEPPALMLRLRLGIGVGVKADVLAFLLCLKGTWSSVKDIAEATSYTTIGARTSLEELAGARLIHEKSGRPIEYSLESDAWARVLEIHPGSVPAWRHWSPLFAFVTDLLEWSTENANLASTYVTSSRARDLFEKHRLAFERNRIQLPRPQDYVGDAYLSAFEETLVRIAQWMRESV